VNLGTADGGNHFRYYQSFVLNNPGVYNGFVGFYALIFLFEHVMGMVPELALLSAIGYSIFVLVWLLSLWAITRGARVVALIPLNLSVIVPITLMLQANGFYPQLYALALLTCLVIVCDQIRKPQRAVALALVGVGILRYSYGLTISDVLVGGGAYLMAHRWFGVGSLLLALAIYTLSLLAPVISLSGAFLPLSTMSLIVSGTLVLLTAREGGQLSYWFMASSFVVWLILGLWFGFEHYYIQKYPIGFCLMAAVVVLPYVSAEQKTRGALALAAILFLCGAVYPYTRNAAGIARRRYVNPEVDLALISTIREALNSRGQPFRVFIGGKWARTNMTNALFGRQYSYQQFESGALPDEMGCVFFDAAEGVTRRLRRDKFPEVSERIQALLEAPHTILTYKAPWASAGTLTIGITCER